MKKIGPIGLISLIGLMFLIQETHAASYYGTIKKELRKGSQYSTDNFHASLIWSVLPLTDKILRAQAKKYQKVYGVSEAERMEFYESLLKKKDSKTLFFISFYSYNQKFNDLTSKPAHWDLRLKKAGKEQKPQRIEKNANPTPFDRVFYPQLDYWAAGYFVWFDGDLDSPYSLILHGPEAHSTLEWKK